MFECIAGFRGPDISGCILAVSNTNLFNLDIIFIFTG